MKNVDTVMGHDKQQLVRRLLLYASPCTPRLCCDGAAVLVLVHRFTEMQTFSLKALAESAVLGLRGEGSCARLQDKGATIGCSGLKN